MSPNNTSITFERTDVKCDTQYLSTRFGEWMDDDVHNALTARYATDDGVEGDPRHFMYGEVGHVVKRRDQIGIQFEFETGFFLGDAIHDEKLRGEIEARSKTEEYACDLTTYSAVVHGFTAYAASLQSAWPQVEVFLADGRWFFDCTLTVCVFVALEGDQTSGFRWPLVGEDKTPEDLVRALQDTSAVELVKNAYKWSQGDRDAAHSEGWDVFISESDLTPALRIQRDDAAAIFALDAWAVEHIRAQAVAGSALHQKALRIHGAPLLPAATSQETLPPDPENFNHERATFAGVAVDAFIAHTRTEPEDALSDLLCNLRHSSDRNNYDFEAALIRGQKSYEEETLANG